MQIIIKFKFWHFTEKNKEKMVIVSLLHKLMHTSIL